MMTDGTACFQRSLATTAFRTGAEGPSRELQVWFASGLLALDGGRDVDPDTPISFLFSLTDTAEVLNLPCDLGTAAIQRPNRCFRLYVRAD